MQHINICTTSIFDENNVMGLILRHTKRVTVSVPTTSAYLTMTTIARFWI